MFQVTQRHMMWGGRKLSLETGRMARQADGAVLAQYGETTVLCTAVWAKSAEPGVDFLPLRVDYQEKFFAAGRIPGSFFKREGRPSETEILNSRLIDRPIRPLFPDGFYHDIHLVATVLVYDNENDPAITAILGCSAALALSGAPFDGPIGAARIGLIQDRLVLNPLGKAIHDRAAHGNALDLVVAGTREGVLMVESEADELSEDQMLEAVTFGHHELQNAIGLIDELVTEVGKPKVRFEKKASPSLNASQDKALKKAVKDLETAYTVTAKQERTQALSDVKSALKAAFAEHPGELPFALASLENHAHKHVREEVLSKKKRIDGRKLNEVRQIACSSSVLPRVHGSSLFTRGETQVLAVTTLGTTQDEQVVDSIEGESRMSFMLHYNFPPYSVGEGGGLRSPGRREIGHGKLAWRALHPLMPTKEKFPYTVRVVAEVTESNGSSSMATVCSSSMAMMDAGVPLKHSCAGIAMGLIKEGERVAVLSDILGDEDHLGDMDFKVAGSERGITALQMDLKITSITSKIMRDALIQAKEGRLGILQHMAQSIKQRRDVVSPHAPKVVTLTVAREKIRDIIGPGGRVIREITSTTGARVDIDDSGTVQVSATSDEAIQKAVSWIERLTAKPEVGRVYHGKVVRVVEFGAFINILEGQDGLLHISEISDRRINKVEDKINVEDQVWVKCVGIDERGRVRLSMKTIDQKTGREKDEGSSREGSSR